MSLLWAARDTEGCSWAPPAQLLLTASPPSPLSPPVLHSIFHRPGNLLASSGESPTGSVEAPLSVHVLQCWWCSHDPHGSFISRLDIMGTLEAPGGNVTGISIQAPRPRAQPALWRGSCPRIQAGNLLQTPQMHPQVDGPYPGQRGPKCCFPALGNWMSAVCSASCRVLQGGPSPTFSCQGGLRQQLSGRTWGDQGTHHFCSPHWKPLVPHHISIT
ncbi:uncharacterized protein LOC120323982 [Pipra filicauda]|uniref:Uncharacterized protein LOC120323982 n=1 Tax=Pipra filicauda TaxID=649802 RepID=A0A7R5KHM8_9PASS|nr:uncharacterized protein LOC120323982 [Pipra filicauda]